jgi:SAM-dependent methyltransferase
MTAVFGDYARYYDLLYRDKDYSGEANFIHELIKKYASNAGSILELGCGTGKHAELLSKMGYEVFGVDMSHEMLEVANKRLIGLGKKQPPKLSFAHGDIRTYRTERRFDVVISLFHVVSYQTTNKDLQGVFETAKVHLKQGGVFIFDCWYGPAVLTDRPVVRVKRLEDEAIEVTRIAEPRIYANESIVDVNYHVLIKNKSTGIVEELKETHRMRYLFKTEIDFLFEQAGFEFVCSVEWMTGREPGFDTWSVCFVGQG